MIYTHNIPVGEYSYNAQIYLVYNNGDIKRINNLGHSIKIARAYSLVDCPLITVHAMELKGLIRTYLQLSNCEIVGQ